MPYGGRRLFRPGPLAAALYFCLTILFAVFAYGARGWTWVSADGAAAKEWGNG